MAYFGVAMEIALAPLCILVPAVGVPVAVSFHLYILSLTPFASVMEWNLACLYMVGVLFHTHNLEPAQLGAADGRLLAFLALVSVLIPAYGQIFPKQVSLAL